MLFGKWSGTEVKIDGVECLIMKESDIMGVMNRPLLARKPPKGCRVKHKETDGKKFSVDARDRMLRGVDILADAVRVTLGPRGATSCSKTSHYGARA